MKFEIRCNGCKKHPKDIPEYRGHFTDDGIRISPQSYLKSEEGTYNPTNGHFWCTSCFIGEEIRIGTRLIGKAV